MTVSLDVREAVAGETADVTTSSRERDLSNNTGARTISFVGEGVVNGNIWNDLNANGVREAGEPSVSAESIGFWSVHDYDPYGISAPDGMFSFEVPVQPSSTWQQTQRPRWT